MTRFEAMVADASVVYLGARQEAETDRGICNSRDHCPVSEHLAAEANACGASGTRDAVGAGATCDAAGAGLTQPLVARRGLAPPAVRRLIGLVNSLSLPACIPIAACVGLLGIACVAVGWWRVLPAILPGDEQFNIERVAGLTLRTLVGWAQPPDAQSTPGLTKYGVGAVIAGIIILLVGLVLNALRTLIAEILVRAASDVRLVVLDDAAAAVVAAEPTPLTTVMLMDQPLVPSKSPLLTLRLDDRFLTDTLPHCAAATRELLALGMDANVNLNLARRLIALRSALTPAQPLERLSVRIDPRELRSSIGRDSFAEFADAATGARLTSLPEARCRHLLRDQPPNKMRLVNRNGRAAIVVVGLGETGLELLARLCAQAQSPSYDPLIIVLVDTEAPAVARELLDLWPAQILAAEFIPLAFEPHLPQSATSLLRDLHKEGLVPTCVYIALENASLAAAWDREIGLAIRLFGQDSPLVLSVDEAIENDRSLLAEDETLELLQRQLHTDYLERWRDAGWRPSAATVEWCRLPFDLQEDNRSVADHLWTKARDLDLRITAGNDVHEIRLAESQIEALAEAEHRRWIASRTVGGWRFGATRSESERTHPSMIPWSQLTESERAKDRDVVRQLPRVLRAAGLVVRPLFGVSVARSGVSEASAAALVAAAQGAASATVGAVPHLILAVEDAGGFRLAKRLTEVADVAVSLVLAQPMAGLAIAAGFTGQAAAQVAKAAQNVWITRPDAIDDVLGRWPTLAGGFP
jgi:RyR domain